MKENTFNLQYNRYHHHSIRFLTFLIKDSLIPTSRQTLSVTCGNRSSIYFTKDSKLSNKMIESG
jgi:hypothetical protein